jgi:formylmethanofuran dehydrogenase subunit E
MQDEDMRCDRCGAIITPHTWWQINVNNKPVCEPCVARGTGGMFTAPREYNRGR